ncbi:hypothetical protein Ancab_005795 [Ancistrocladus abbreviatus]
MGGLKKAPKWHVYSASAELLNVQCPVHTLEMCMAGLDKESATIRVTPEGGFSYASFEAVDYKPKELDFSELHERQSFLWRYIHADEDLEAATISVLAIDGYSLEEGSYEALDINGESITHHQFVKSEECGSPTSILKYCWTSERKARRLKRTSDESDVAVIYSF